TADQNGEPIIGDATDVELAAGYTGEPEKLARVLVEVHLLDQLEDGRLQVHDYWDHAPEYVCRRRHKEQARKIELQCKYCGKRYHPRAGQQQYCQDSCRVANHRQKTSSPGAPAGDEPNGERNADVTQGNEAPRYRNAGVTQGNDPLTPSPSPAQSTSQEKT